MRGTREAARPILGPNETNEKKTPPVMEPPPKKKRKADVFQRVFQRIVRVVREVWLEHNTDRHNPLQGQNV